jgi:hypothetical protein
LLHAALNDGERVPLWGRLRAALQSYPAMTGLTVAFIATRFFQPFYTDNEPVYALSGIKLLQPSFLPTHPFLERFNPFFWVYDAATAPLYLVLSWLTATLVIRVALWVLQAWALGRLLRALGLPAWALLVTALLWLNVEQTLVAGEVVVGAAAGKPAAYGFLFLALSYGVEERWTRVGIFAGIATGCHVLVGGWGMLAIGVAALVGGRAATPWRRALTYGCPAAAIALLALGPALWSMVSNPVTADPAALAAADRLNVLWVNPFHLDPDFFMTGLEGLKVALYMAATLALIAAFLPRDRSRQIIVFLGTLALVFLAGLVARRAELYSLLKYYPFRVADGMYPLFFWIGVAAALVVGARRLGRRGGWLVVAAIPLLAGGARWLNNVLEPRDFRDPQIGSFMGALSHGEPRITAYEVRERLQEWRRLASGNPGDPLAAMEWWVRVNTPADAVVLIPPWEYGFMINARRSEFITFKTFTVQRMAEWHERMEALYGEPITDTGWGIVKALRKSYPEMPAARVRSLGRRFRVTFFLTDSPQSYDLPLVHTVGAWRLYAIPDVVAGPAESVATPARIGADPPPGCSPCADRRLDGN